MLRITCTHKIARCLSVVANILKYFWLTCSESSEISVVIVDDYVLKFI